MLKPIFWGFLLSITTVVFGKNYYVYRPKANGWLKLHKASANWKNAFLKCHYEGAVLASPLNEELLEEMRLLINSQSHFIGAHARFSPGEFVSIEGVPLDNMPVSDMFQTLNTDAGECLRSDGYSISVESCMNKLPYICYRSYKSERNLTECGTFDKGYKFESSTGSCYKVHQDLHSWPEANSICISEGGYLAILNDKKEAHMVHSMFPDKKLDFQWKDLLYIGLRDWNSNGTWLTIHGEPLDELYNVWDEEQTDHFEQYCGALTREGKLYNTFCHFASFFVCEKNPKNMRYVLGD